MASAPELDAALLAALSTRWAKVAMVFGRAERAKNLSFDEHEDIFEAFTERLRVLVNSGRVLANGDLKEWRFSEVRLATSTEETDEL
jgi:hypothetical protein